MDGRPAVDEGAVAVEDREPVHFLLLRPVEPRARRSPRRSRRRALAAAATLRCLASGLAFGCSSGRLSPPIGLNPSVARLSEKCAGSSAVTSITPPSGASILIRRA